MKAIVTGISGQDGYYIAEQLLSRGVSVLGLSSSEESACRSRREFANRDVVVELFDYQRPQAFTAVVEAWRPNLVFNLAAKSTGQGMFDAPFEMGRLNGGFVLDILEAIRTVDPSIAFVQASSAEMYGDVTVCPQDERTPFRPISPYGAAKLYAHNLIGVYRSAFGLRCSSAILYNHESPRRTTAFVTRKIARAAAAIALGQERRFSLGSVDAQRDWGYAPEYADAMVRMALASNPRDYVVATGRLTSVARACEICFGHLGLDYREYLDIDVSLQRAVKTVNVCGDPRTIYNDLGWKSEKSVESLLSEMVVHDFALLSAAGAREM